MSWRCSRAKEKVREQGRMGSQASCTGSGGDALDGSRATDACRPNGRGGGRGKYRNVDGDLPGAAEYLKGGAQAVAQSPMPLNSSSGHDSLGAAAFRPPVALAAREIQCCRGPKGIAPVAGPIRVIPLQPFAVLKTAP
jgi:hypothetical protein